MRKHLAITVAVGAAALIGGAIAVGVARAGDAEDDRAADQQNAYKQTNLVSSLPNQGALHMDLNLKNPWGMAWVPGGAMWVANNATQLSTLYIDEGIVQPLVVTIPGKDSAPTGMVWNEVFGVGNQFQFSAGNPSKTGAAIFIFDGEDGKITAWNPDVSGKTTAAVVVDNAGKAIYKGLAFGTVGEPKPVAGNYIFATNFFTGTVEAYNANFARTTLAGAFRDPDMPKNYAPFNVVNLDGVLFVTFAQQDAEKKDDVPGPGKGFVDVFTTNGRLIRRFASRGVLNAPWGVVRAPIGFGKFGGAILIGNFGDGRINAFDNRGNCLGELRDPRGKAISISGLWSLKFGTFQEGGPEELYFTAGINGEQDGLMGQIEAVSGRH